MKFLSIPVLRKDSEGNLYEERTHLNLSVIAEFKSKRLETGSIGIQIRTNETKPREFNVICEGSDFESHIDVVTERNIIYILSNADMADSLKRHIS